MYTTPHASDPAFDRLIAARPRLVDVGGVGPMSGAVTKSMPLLIARDEATGLEAWCPLNEGSGKVLRYGADGPEVVDRLKWMAGVLGPSLSAALKATGPIDLLEIQRQALLLGDEAHHRTEEGTAIFAALLKGHVPAEVRTFMEGNGQWFLNLAMVSAKFAMNCAAGVEGSSLVTVVARNGVEVGVKLSGTGDAWFVGTAALPDPFKLYEGYGPLDMNPDLGDSAIVEVYGLGALAVAGSPQAAPSVGLSVDEIDEIDAKLRPIAAADCRGRASDDPLHSARRLGGQGDARGRRARGGGHRTGATDPHGHREPQAGHRADRRRHHAPAVLRLRRRGRGARRRSGQRRRHGDHHCVTGPALADTPEATVKSRLRGSAPAGHQRLGAPR